MAMRCYGRIGQGGPFALFVLLLSTLLGEGAPAVSTATSTLDAGAVPLIAELGCANCHGELGIPATFLNRIPDLSGAGLRYSPSYLFSYLQNPQKVRHHLGRARMPDFHLEQKEALALAMFLATQRQPPRNKPSFPKEILELSRARPQPISKQQFQTDPAAGLLCLACHALEGHGGTQAVDLATFSYRLQPDWVRQFLVAPAAFGVAPAAMPSSYYHANANGTAFEAMSAQAARRIQMVTDYLFSLNLDRRQALEKEFTEAKAAVPQVSAVLGEALFRALNCAGCHAHASIPPRKENAAPDLSREGNRVNKEWLLSFLKQPEAIRPFGYRPGEGSRMPNFRLSPGEIAELGRFLLAQRNPLPRSAREFQPRPLSAFAQAKARALLDEKLSCLGCHRLGERGGMIGPDLTGASRRLQAEYVHAIISDPLAVAPHSIMPRVPLTAATIELLSSFLLQQEPRPAARPYLSLVEHPLISLASPAAVTETNNNVRASYLLHCAPCHGTEGQADGFNARYLLIRPTIHADAAFMKQRPDDTLYDGIQGGGYILNKSPFMPPWGETLSPIEIKQLVGFLRTLCHCEGPSWSRDNSALSP